MDTNSVGRALFAAHDAGRRQLDLPRLADRGVQTQWRRSAAYLADVLAKLANLWPAARLDELLPWA